MEQLGIQPSLLLAQVVNFGIIIFVLSKLLYKPILNVLDKRKAEIDEGLRLTEKMRLEEENLKKKSQKVIDEARKDARIIIEQAKKDAKDAERSILEEAHGEASKIIEKSKEESDKIKEKMIADVKKDAVELAVAMTKRLTSVILSETDQRKLISRHIKELEGRSF